MLKEQNLNNVLEKEIILKTLEEKGKYSDEINEFKYFGDKKLLEENQEEKNYLIGKYKDIYIGILLYDKPNIRDNFGLNIYFNDIFYFGEWKENKKEGIGFLELKENILYLGHFSNNQINGFGILYYKDKQHIFFGEFINGTMDNGLYYNIEDSIFYQGKFVNGKKNSKYCSYFDFNNSKIYVGEIKDDNFINGYFSLCDIQETKDNNEIITSFTCSQIIYFDKRDKKNIIYEHSLVFENNFYDLINKIFCNIFEFNLDIKDIHENYIALFENFENIVYNDSYTEYLDRYNPEEKMNIKTSFLRNYKNYEKRFIQTQEKFNIKIYENIVRNEPTIRTDLKNEIEKK